MDLARPVSRSRYVLKKVTRALVAEASAMLQAPAAVPCIRVFTYHRFHPVPGRDPFALTPELFDRQVRWLGEHMDVLTPGRFIQLLGGYEPLTRDAALITIDDGHASALVHALPVLERHSAHALFFVCPGLIDAARIRAPQDSQCASWGDLERLRVLGHEVVSHGLFHRSLGRIPLEEAEREIVVAGEQLHARLGGDPPFFAFPFGRAADFSPAVVDVLQAHGYRFLFTSIHGSCSVRQHSSVLPRVKVESGESMRMFMHIAMGNMDSWSYVDRLAGGFA